MKLLLISYVSPADKITGGFRPASFTKFFPEAGINVSFLTSHPDILKNKEILEKYNIQSVELVRPIRIRNIGYKLKILALMETLKLDTLFFFPDIFRFWNRRAGKKAQQMIDREKIDAIIVTGPPHSPYYMAYKLAKKNNLPLIVDYRDPLTGSPFMYFPPIIKQIVRRKERKIVNYAKLVITVGEECSALITNSLKLKDKEIHVIYNGFFEEDRPDLTVEKRSKFTVSYFGHFYILRQKGFEALVAGMRRMIDKHNLSPDDIVLQYAGKISRKTLQKILDGSNMKDYFNDLGLLSGNTLFKEINQSTLNVVLVPPKTTYTLPTKIYDYAFCNSHIFLVGEKGEVTRWCEKVDQIYTQTTMNPEEISEDLWQLFTKWKSKSLEFGCDEEKILEFSRRNLALKLAEKIKKAIK